MMAKKRLYILIGVAVLLAVILAAVYFKKYNQPVPVTAEVSAVQTTTIKVPAAGSIKPSTKAPLSATKAYLDALKIYKTTGYYFQFVDCHGAPGTLTLKAGKKFMLDNRDGVARKIAIQGGQSFNVGAYGFAIATAPSKIGTHYITCNGGGAASILVQK